MNVCTPRIYWEWVYTLVMCRSIKINYRFHCYFSEGNKILAVDRKYSMFFSIFLFIGQQ